MVKASEDFLSRFATRVCLEIDENASGGSIYDSDLILRKEPFSGCVSAMEAVARTLRVLEPNGFEIESKLIEILREMVRLQAGYLKPMIILHYQLLEGYDFFGGIQLVSFIEIPIP
ncbi:hypothetical protein L6164_033996 [Bauhinia variegata]|uniref:Uncharacterized protein n=1 Tax=Bauhinia variegata TaxID=167791 RepID=A0ACB9KU89_BAUVA|nr:hypothetical protein L6164_033996 [Bauhinia variegata]